MNSSHDKLIAFLCPSFATTEGHRAITACVNTVAGHLYKLRRTRIVPIFDDPPYSGHTLRWISEAKPDIVLVDFPDKGIADDLVKLRGRLDSTFVYMGMMATDYGRSTFPYDLLIELEPDTRSCANVRNRIEVCPIVQADRFSQVPPLRYTPSSNSIVWFESGTSDEREEMFSYLNREYGPDLVRSASLPQPAAPYLRHWSRIISASGYSATWELNALGLFDLTTWFTYDRTLEDCERRIAFLRSNKTRAVRLGEDTRTGYGLLELTAVLRHLIDGHTVSETVDWFYRASPTEPPKAGPPADANGDTNAISEQQPGDGTRDAE